MARYAVSEVARKIDVSPSTVRNWAGQFADYLSQAANPPANEPRAFTDDDLAALATVAMLRAEKRKYEEIEAILAAGELVELPPEEPESQAGESETALVTRLSMTVARYEGELEATKEALTHTREELDNERQARIEAETQAARLVGKLEAIESRRHWWEIWKRKPNHEQ